MENSLRHARFALSVAMHAKSGSGLEFERLDLASSGSLLAMTRRTRSRSAMKMCVVGDLSSVVLTTF